MAEHYEIQVPTHNSIYGDCSEIEAYEREMNVYFSVPEKGVGVNTGLLLLIAGFGGHAQANVYKKMREQFADQYNLVVVQCDYFGWEYMQEPSVFHLENGCVVDKNLLNCFQQQGISSFCAYGKWEKEENLDYFNEMGLMQAIDNVVAVLSVVYILQSKGFSLKGKGRFLYGYSHGAYLSYFCNMIAPGLFDYLIDNSAWLIPTYLRKGRRVSTDVSLSSWEKENIEMEIRIKYLTASIEDALDGFNLNQLYFGFENKCKIISYHGVDDNLIKYKEKEDFCRNIANCELRIISEKEIDGIVFKSAKHGLNADFLELFHYTMQKFVFEKKRDESKEIAIEDTVEFETNLYRYVIDYTSGLPFIERKKK